MLPIEDDKKKTVDIDDIGFSSEESSETIKNEPINNTSSEIGDDMVLELPPLDDDDLDIGDDFELGDFDDIDIDFDMNNDLAESLIQDVRLFEQGLIV